MNFVRALYVRVIGSERDVQLCPWPREAYSRSHAHERNRYCRCRAHCSPRSHALVFILFSFNAGGNSTLVNFARALRVRGLLGE